MAKPNFVFTKPWAYGRASKDAPYPPQIQNMPGSGRTSIEQGFPDETMLPPAYGGIPPYGQDFNGILKAITENLTWYSAGGIFEYDSNRDYVPPCLITHKNNLYYCLKASNALAPVEPGTNKTYWLQVLDVRDVEPILSDMTGMIGWFGGTKPPSGNWIIANGQAVSRTLYKGLFNYYGTLHGTGDGSTTFNVPNLIDRFPMGASGSIGQFVEAGLPNILGGLTHWDGTITPYGGGAFYDNTTQGSSKNGKKGQHDHRGYVAFDASRSDPIYGNSNTVQPPAVRLLPCVHV